jgi:hypothetical protein
MRKAFLVSALVGLAAAVGLAAPASAEETTTTVTVSAADGLSITVPATANLGSGDVGTSISGSLGVVTVTDERALLAASWVSSVIATDFTTGAATSPETIPNINVTYWSGGATATTGAGTFTPGQAAAGDAVIVNVLRTAFSHTTGSGDNSASWNPHVVIAVPAGKVAGIYTGTVTHTVL